MASARPSKAYRGGGGFLNNVDGTIKDYVFTDKAPNSNESGEWLYLKLSVLVDGAEAAVSTHLFAGAAERFLPLADKGRTLGGDNALGANTPAIKFLESMMANGFDENELPDDKVNYEAIIGRRARFVQQVDEEANKKIGQAQGGRQGIQPDPVDGLGGLSGHDGQDRHQGRDQAERQGYRAVGRGSGGRDAARHPQRERRAASSSPSSRPRSRSSSGRSTRCATRFGAPSLVTSS
jgi:hypothetical protein